MPSASHSRSSDATETLARSRSSLDTKPLVSPLCSATSAMLIRAASRAARSCAPIRRESAPWSGSRRSLVPGTGTLRPEPAPVAHPGHPCRTPPAALYRTPPGVMKQGLTARKPMITICARRLPEEAPMAAPGVTAQEQDRGLLGQIEVHSIDWIPDPERHGKTWQQAMLWFLGNF